MAGTLDSCPLNRGVRLIGVSVKRGSTVLEDPRTWKGVYVLNEIQPGMLRTSYHRLTIRLCVLFIVLLC